MAGHKFATGDRVMLVADASNINARPGIYTVVRVMPATDQGFQYRVKNAQDNHERVMNEAQLRSV